MSVRELPPALAEKAKNELNEDPKRLKDDLQHIKDWIAKQPHLNARTDDQWLVSFLRGCKYSLERTKEKMDLYYTIRLTAPEMFTVKYGDPVFEEILSSGAILALPKTSGPDSPRVILIRPGRLNPDKINILENMAVTCMLYKIMLMEDDNATVAGIITIADLEGVTMAHYLQMTPLNIKKMVVAGQDSLPLRFKGAHFINTPPGFETLFNLVKSLINERNRSKLYVHNKDFEALYKCVPKDILPVEYGGNGGTIEEIIGYWRKKMNEYSSFFEDDMKYGTNESKRLGTPKTAESMFGVEGSFRKLEVD